MPWSGFINWLLREYKQHHFHSSLAWTDCFLGELTSCSVLVDPSKHALDVRNSPVPTSSSCKWEWGQGDSQGDSNYKFLKHPLFLQYMQSEMMWNWFTTELTTRLHTSLWQVCLTKKPELDPLVLVSSLVTPTKSQGSLSFAGVLDKTLTLFSF